MKDRNIFKKIGIRTFALFGLTFFTTSITNLDIKTNLISATLTAGLYFFTELCRYYHVSALNKKGKIVFEYLLW